MKLNLTFLLILVHFLADRLHFSVDVFGPDSLCVSPVVVVVSFVLLLITFHITSGGPRKQIIGMPPLVVRD